MSPLFSYPFNALSRFFWNGSRKYSIIFCFPDLVSKVTKIVEKILAEKTQEDEEKKENKKNEDDEKANKISSYEKSNSLRQASKLYVADTFNYKTRAEKIAESNKKYSL